ncbi:MAG: LAGLIDADG family homing endonuclease [Fervidobacterium sp.]|nr:LAGLIDADG family homing endonuclease [Fervidobacterium sp.]
MAPFGLITIAEFYEKVNEPEVYIKGEFVKLLKEPVYTIGWDGEAKPARIVAVHKIPYKGKVVEVEAESARFLTSGDHLFLVYEPRYNRYRYVKARDLSKYNYGLAIPDTIVSLPFKQTIDENLAYLAGLFIADGVWSKSAILFCLHKDEAPIIVEYLKKLGYNCSIKSEKRPTNGRTIPTYGLISTFKKIFKDRNKNHIPKELLKQPANVLLALGAGIIDGDGHFDKDRARIRISTTSEKLAHQLVYLFSVFGWNPHLTSQPPAGKGKHTVYQISIYGESYLRAIKALTPYLKLKKIKHLETRRKYHYIHIKSIKEFYYDGFLYDLTTETGNYLAGKNGMAFTRNARVLF